MRNIKTFESFLLGNEIANFHARRNKEVLLSLPGSREGAIHAIKLYQPQKWLARLKASVLHFLARQGIHSWFLTQENALDRSSTPPWDFDYSPDTVGVLLGSSEHLVQRAIASYRGKNGWEVAKLGIGQEARLMLRRESKILQTIAARGLDSPRCLGLHELGEMTLLRMPYMVGTSLHDADPTGAINLLLQWIEDAPRKAIIEFDEWKSIHAALESTAGGRKALDSLSGHMLQPVTAHGDFARWNLLRQPDGRLVALDWEWGCIAGMPGLDLVHYFAQEARLVRRLNSENAIRMIEIELLKPQALNYLVQTGWGLHTIELIVACAAYKQGALHQKNPDFLGACVKEYLARQCEALHDSKVVSLPLEKASTHRLTSGQPPSNSPASKPTAAETEARIRISVITPSFKQVDLLKCCAASVRDQALNFRVEHLIQDGGSGGEFTRWAASQQGAVCVSESDGGMYDAINNGFRKAGGDIIAWLNCDEQYLPNTIERVSNYFEAHPETDILFGDVILVNEIMTPLAYRKAVMPSVGHIRHSHLSTFSAATFIRRRVLDEGHYLQTRWKTIADAVWIEELLTSGYRAATLNEPLAIFCMLGSNLGQSTLLFEERIKWEKELRATNHWIKKWHIFKYRLSRLRAGAYLPRKIIISAYNPGSQDRRKQSRWVSGQWAMAREEAANLRTWRDGTMGKVVKNSRLSRWSHLHAACLIGIAVYLDRITQGDAVKGPFVLLFSLMFLSFRSQLKDLIPIAVSYFIISGYLLSERPTDVMIVRLGTFTLGAILAIFWSTSLRNLEAWIQGTIGLIRRIPGSIILTDRSGKIILVNNSACKILESEEIRFLNQQLSMTAAGPEVESNPLAIADWGERPPTRILELVIENGSESVKLTASVLAVGTGKYLFYAFMVHQPDEE